LNTRCFECHQLPTFASALAVAVGVPSPDGGVGAVSGLPAQRGLFAVPTLRNVALTAPYMHDGSLATLAEVVRFYRNGGGIAHGIDPSRVHEFVRPISMRDDEAADLVAFLHALTDETPPPPAPDALPSDLPVLTARPLAVRSETNP
jgi:cytochrome c peroxidase